MNVCYDSVVRRMGLEPWRHVTALEGLGVMFNRVTLEVRRTRLRRVIDERQVGVHIRQGANRQCAK